MSTNGLEVFDKTVQTTNIWLNEITDRIGGDRQQAWKCLSVILHALRDHLPVELAAHVGAQLPLLVRGAYYDQFEPSKLPADCTAPDEFIREVSDRVQEDRAIDPEAAVAAIFAVLGRHLSPGLIAKVRTALPRGLQILWDGTEARILADAEA